LCRIGINANGLLKELLGKSNASFRLWIMHRDLPTQEQLVGLWVGRWSTGQFFAFPRRERTPQPRCYSSCQHTLRLQDVPRLNLYSAIGPQDLTIRSANQLSIDPNSSVRASDGSDEHRIRT
jgi:hypothetical protein